MAKIVPQGYANINAYDEGDNFFKLLEYIDRYGSRVDARREQKEGNDVSSMEYLLQKIESAPSINELNQYKNQYSTIIDPNYVSDNNLYNLYKSEVDSKITSQENNLNEINKLASNFYIKMTSTDNQVGTSLLNMDRDSIYNYYDSMSDEDKGGWVPELAKERYELQSLVELMDTTFKGQNPNSPINYVDANGKKQTVRMRDFRRLLNQYDDQMQALIDGGFEDGILSREEAMAISSITGRDNRTVDYFYKTREKKIADYKAMLQGATKNQNNILNKTISLFNNKDTGNNAFQQAVNQFISQPENTQNDLTQGVAAAANSKAVEENFPAELGQLEGLSTEEKYIKIMEAVTSGSMSKEKLMFLLQDAARENSDFEQMAIDGLKAWGGNSLFEYKKDPRDIAKELSETGEPIIPGTTDQFGYATGMSIGETEETVDDRQAVSEEPADDRQAVSEEVIDDRQAVSEEPITPSIPVEEVADTLNVPIEEAKDTTNAAIRVEKATENVQSDSGSSSDWIIPASITAIAYNADKIAATGEYLAKGTVKSAKYLNAAIQLNATQVENFLNDSNVQKVMEEINKVDDEIEEIREKISNLDKKKRKGTIAREQNKIKKLLEKRKLRTDFVVNKYSKKWGKDKNVVGKLFKQSQLDKWNIFKLRGQIKNGIPSLASKIFKPINAVSSVYLPYTVGYNVTAAFGLDDELSKNIGGIGMLATAKKLYNIAQTPSGKKALMKFASKVGAQKIVGGVAAGGGYFSLITGLIGAGLTVYDIYNWVQGYEEETE